jgi:hypothetical protein
VLTKRVQFVELGTVRRREPEPADQQAFMSQHSSQVSGEVEEQRRVFCQLGRRRIRCFSQTPEALAIQRVVSK